jgi:response regulator RpfG family c-di-GMP phosphodiesterase
MALPEGPWIYMPGALHDLGKIGIPDAVLLKNYLTPRKKSIMNGHPEIGYSIISRIGYFAPSAEIVRSHREHLTERAIRGLKGLDIPVGARVSRLPTPGCLDCSAPLS